MQHVREKLLKGDRLRRFLRENGASLRSKFPVSTGVRDEGFGTRNLGLGVRFLVFGLPVLGSQTTGPRSARVRPRRSQPPTLHHQRVVAGAEGEHGTMKNRAWPRAACAVFSTFFCADGCSPFSFVVLIVQSIQTRGTNRAVHLVSHNATEWIATMSTTRPTSSHIMYQSNGFRKSTPQQISQLPRKFAHR